MRHGLGDLVVQLASIYDYSFILIQYDAKVITMLSHCVKVKGKVGEGSEVLKET